MSLIKDPVIDNLIATSKKTLEWISCSEFTDIEPTQIDNVYYAIRNKPYSDRDEVETMITLVLLGNDEICTPTFVSEFARIYSLPKTQVQ